MIGRVTDGMQLRALVDQHRRLQTRLATLQEQLATGKRLISADVDPVAAGAVLRSSGTLAALGQFDTSSRFGLEVLGAEDAALGQGTDLLVRAEEIATTFASDGHTQADRDAAAEEVHGLLQALTALGNSSSAGRRVFGGLAQDAAAPFADPDGPGYTAASAYTGSTYEFELRTGDGESVRLTTRGDAVFGQALQGLEALETALRTPGTDVATTLAGLASGRDAITGERTSVGTRETLLQARLTTVQARTADETARRSRLEDADVIAVVTELTQVQQALETLLAAAGRQNDTSLASLLRI